jgi:ribose 5-phosphate isomerase B
MGRVITEREVRDAAAKEKRIDVDPTDVITPAARDAARETGVVLSAVAHAAGGDTTTAPHVVMGADHGGTQLKESLKPVIQKLGFHMTDVGSHGSDPVDYPVFAARVAETVATGAAEFGIVVDGAGIGSCMVANKIRGARAALCYDITTARNAREHNDANVLTLGGTLIGTRLAAEIVTTFLSTPFAAGRHARRVAMIDALDGRSEGRREQKTGDEGSTRTG